MPSVDPSELQSWLEAEAETLRAELARLVEERPAAEQPGGAASRDSSIQQGGDEAPPGERGAFGTGPTEGGAEAVAGEVRSLLRELERQTRLGEEGVKLLASLQEQLRGGVIRFES